MAQTTTIDLMPDTYYPGPIGTAVTLIGEAKPAASYYLAHTNTQTISWALNDSFTGDIKIQASLKTPQPAGSSGIATVPENEDWFDVYIIDTSEQYGYYNLEGSFVWIRAVVTNWTGGNIQLITVSY
jgi:hypothetical protein